jgi:hypothetical protein
MSDCCEGFLATGKKQTLLFFLLTMSYEILLEPLLNTGKRARQPRLGRQRLPATSDFRFA